MGDLKIKQRHQRAVNAAVKCLSKSGYYVVILKDGVFHLQAERPREIRKIRIVLEQPDSSMIGRLNDVPVSKISSKEIWIKKFKSRNFETIEV